MNTIDIILVACAVAVAAAFLARALLGGGRPPACHQLTPQDASGAEANVVVVGASLQRALDRARARRG